MTRAPKVFALARDPASDPCVGLVAAALASRGVELRTIATGPYPAACPIELEPRPHAPRILLGGHRLDDADAIWLRHLDPDGLPGDLRPDERAAARQQAEAALWAALACAPGLLLDPPEALLAVPAKPRLQQLAAAFGLDVPRTLVTSDPAALRAFAAACPGGLVGKLVDSGALTAAGAGPAVPTFALDDLGDLAGLELAPMIFQERLDKRLELRVTIVGHDLFVAGLDPRGALDVRCRPDLLAELRPSRDLPPALGRRLLDLCTHLGLNFATADLVRGADGRWVLLDLNSTSYFDHVERVAGLDISGALADLLLGRRPPRARRRPAP